MVNIILPATAAASFAAGFWDYVIVGGGTAGLALASRLSEDPSIRVAVLEAGLDNSTDPAVSVVGNWATTYMLPGYNWGFQTSPQLYAAGQTIALPRGKLLGGSSAINAMEWTLASKDEYDAIASLGNCGWDYNSLLPYFKKAENYTAQIGNPIFPGAGNITSDKGTNGPVIVSWNLWYSSLASKFINTLKGLSFNINTDPESGCNSGVSNVARAADNSKAARQFSAVTYLPLAMARNNIEVLVGAQATKITFNSTNKILRATGVEFVAGGKKYFISAHKEVILSAGALMTPQLLELSGIGINSILSKFGIPTLVDLPVGENLQDQLMLSMEFSLNSQAQSTVSLQSVPANLQVIPGKTDAASSMTGTPFFWTSLESIASSSGFAELISILDSYLCSDTLTPLERAQFLIQKEQLTNAPTVAEVQFICSAYPGTPGLPLGNGTFGMWMPSAHVHPLSRGSVHIQSANPLVLPLVDPKYLSRDFDLKALLQVANFSLNLVKTGELGYQVSGPIAPPPNITTVSDMTLWIKSNIATLFHQLGTAPMASRSLGGIVDSELIVYGTRNLRVVDASVIPIQIAATTQATVYAIAEKAADMIKNKCSARVDSGCKRQPSPDCHNASY